jgi:hypothetical protein
VEIILSPVSGAAGYRFEYSTDAGQTWQLSGEQAQPKRTFRPVSGEAKGYVRVRAVNREHTSRPSRIYPVYFTDRPPHFPDGLKVLPEKSRSILTWGSVLGCNQYKLYKRSNAGKAWTLLYTGTDNRFVDTACPENVICEYAVTSVNGNGESDRSNPVTTDPDSWLNFVPVKGEPFRRVIGGENPVDNEGNTTPSYYPE